MAAITVQSSSTDSRIQNLTSSLINAPASDRSALTYFNVITKAFFDESDRMAYDLANRYVSDTLVSPTTWRIQTTNYTVQVTGTFSTSGSSASRIEIFNKLAGNYSVLSGTLNYPGLPLTSLPSAGSSIDYFWIAMTPSFSGYKSLVALFDTSLTYTSTGLTGKLQSYTESLSDYSDNQTIATYYSTGSFSDVGGTLTIQDAALDSISFSFSGTNGTTIADSVTVGEISQKLSEVAISNPFASIIAGNDTMSLKGSGAMPAFSGSGDDTITNGPGNTAIDGGSGIDTLMQSGKRSNYSISKVTSGTTISYSITDNTGTEGVDTITAVEKIRFADVTINTEIGTKAKAIATADLQLLEELYVAFFNRVPDADGLSYWIDQRKAGLSIDQIAQSFYSAAVQFSNLTGYSDTMSNGDFVRVIYKNVLGRSGVNAPPDADVNYWAAELSEGRATKGSLVSTMLDSAHSFKGNPTWGWVANLLDNKVSVANYFAVQQGLNYNTSEDSISQGMAIAAAITSTDTTSAISLIGVADQGFSLT